MNQRNRKRNHERDTTAGAIEGVRRGEHLIVDAPILAGAPAQHGEAIGRTRVTHVVTPGSATGAARGAANAGPIPAMTSDNTASPSPMTGIINAVRPGMRVVDASGEELGTVDDVKMGDPGAATVGADMLAEPGLFGADAEPDVPEPLRSRLLRFGYVRIDVKGWFDTDRYLTADLIGRVSGDAVILTVAKDRVLDDRL
ncbi:MAG: hypothetical protein AVDCRST_MAG19-1669 [uncultured Thermomicrobiales bacterium]|uniref:PRC-barrel domain-containing protein n=1 Tax=uncultured Thermomicrobiales bacterium TaxID=1645740 RepID=A0A6J4UVA6_9BACT|nr:MAG: hypothetical protein AVDCRST_MAG19-1669 [uncultured Thermomicrobiales bacterium]